MSVHVCVVLLLAMGTIFGMHSGGEGCTELSIDLEMKIGAISYARSRGRMQASLQATVHSI